MGIANAFANAGNLETLGTGVALAVTPAANGTVPQAEINTLANVLASCVNSNGTGTACATLFANAESGGTTGTVATDTASAAINIAHNPGAGVAALYGLASGTPPFGGGLTGVPNDWTVAISFTGNGLSYPFGIAIDGAGNAWVASAGDNSICEMSSSGAPLSGANGYAASGLNFPRYIAIDPSGDAWVAGNTQPDVVEVSGKGATLSGSSGYTGFDQVGDNAVIGATGIAIDGSGNVWVPDSSSNYELSEFANNGSFVGWISAHQFAISYPYGVAVDASGNAWITDLYGQSLGVFSSAAFTGYSYGTGYTVYGPLGGLDDERNIAIDGSGDVWVTNAVGNSVSEISKNGAAVSGAGGYTGTGLANPNAIAIDGAGDVWVTNATANSVVKLSNSGAVLTGASGYLSGNSNPLSTLAVDGSGDLWVVVDAGNSVEEAVGAATPVVTPLSVGVENNMLGTRP
jgi:streptogramin lyase